jgi:hypothetical protein
LGLRARFHPKPSLSDDLIENRSYDLVVVGGVIHPENDGPPHAYAGMFRRHHSQSDENVFAFFVRK